MHVVLDKMFRVTPNDPGPAWPGAGPIAIAAWVIRCVMSIYSLAVTEGIICFSYTSWCVTDECKAE